MSEKNDKAAPGAKPAASAPKPAGAPKPAARPISGPAPAFSASGKELRGIVRLVGRDIKGQVPLVKAIATIRGMGLNVGQLVGQVALRELKLDPKTMIGELDEHQIHSLEQILIKPQEHGIPAFMLNRRREYATNETHHAIGTDLVYAVKQDVDHEKDSYTWKGYRHAYGQKVRGQHTRSTGRTGMTVGVIRKAVAGKAAGAPTAAAAQQASAPGAAGAKPAAGADKKPAEKAPAAAAAKPAAPAAKPAEKK